VADNSKLRRQIAIELACFLIGSVAYLGLWRHRPHYADMTFGFVGMSLVLLFAWRTREQIWGPPLPEPRRRLKESLFAMFLWTAPTLIAFAIAASVIVRRNGGGSDELLHRLFRPNFFLSLAFYFVYAWLQQALFQFYMLGRLRVLLPAASLCFLAVLNGALYALMHLAAMPDPMLVALTFVGGIVWTLCYYRWRCLLPVALSHMFLGATYFYWVRDSDKMADLLALIGH
jgi:membrane protease YdiL (CAAX protease family)